MFAETWRYFIFIIRGKNKIDISKNIEPIFSDLHSIDIVLHFRTGLLTGQRPGNGNLPPRCCHGVALVRKNQRTLLRQTETRCEAVDSSIIPNLCMFVFWHFTFNKCQRMAGANEPKWHWFVCEVQRRRTLKTRETNSLGPFPANTPLLFLSTVWIIFPLHSEIPSKSLCDLFITLNMSNTVFGSQSVNIHSKALLSLSHSTKSHLVRWQPLCLSSWMATLTKRWPYFNL